VIILQYSSHVSQVQLFVPSSHCSHFSLILFQQIAVVFLQSNQHLPSNQFLVQLSHSSRGVFIFQSQQVCRHFVHKSAGQLLHVSHRSITPFQQFGFKGSFFVHVNVHILAIVQLFSQSSHSSVPSSVWFQHVWFGFTVLQSVQHNQSYPLLFEPLSHSSQGSLIPFQHDQVHFPTSLVQDLQSSAASILLFPQYALHFQTSFSHDSQSSSSSAILFQHHVSSQSSIHLSFKSASHVSQVSHISIFPFGQLCLSTQLVVQL